MRPSPESQDRISNLICPIACAVLVGFWPQLSQFMNIDILSRFNTNTVAVTSQMRKLDTRRQLSKEEAAWKHLMLGMRKERNISDLNSEILSPFKRQRNSPPFLWQWLLIHTSKEVPFDLIQFLNIKGAKKSEPFS